VVPVRFGFFLSLLVSFEAPKESESGFSFRGRLTNPDISPFFVAGNATWLRLGNVGIFRVFGPLFPAFLS
jgi:hypothetical protein